VPRPTTKPQTSSDTVLAHRTTDSRPTSHDIAQPSTGGQVSVVSHLVDDTPCLTFIKLLDVSGTAGTLGNFEAAIVELLASTRGQRAVPSHQCDAGTDASSADHEGKGHEKPPIGPVSI
jgi:hypothetical protein